MASGSGRASLYRAALALPYGFGKPGEPLPVALGLELERPLTKGPETARKKLSQPTVLIRAQDASVGCCWFSGPVELDDKTDERGIWVLEKTDDEWILRLKRISYEAQWFEEYIPYEEVAVYAIVAKYTEKLRLAWQNDGSKEFDWPSIVTIESAL
jgi:hypothetical protein